jgi:hypothetical protein
MNDFSKNMNVVQQSKAFLIISILFGLVFNITFIVLFIMYTGTYSPVSSCASLISWDKSLYISMIIYLVFNLIENAFRFNAGNEPIDSGFFQLVTFVSGGSNFAIFVCWIGIQSVYFNLSPGGACGSLGDVNLAYIVSAYVMLAISLLVCLIMCCCMGVILGLMASNTTAIMLEESAKQNDENEDKPLDDANERLIEEKFENEKKSAPGEGDNQSGNITDITQ